MVLLYYAKNYGSLVMKFREHRGALSASIGTAVELEPTAEALAKHLSALDLFGAGLVAANNVVVETYHNEPDRRIDWERTCIVTISGQEGVFGFTDQLLQ